ncbi:MAG: hypothetical protein QXY90_05420 [Candidatus Anstonellales archaeon]
MDFLSVVSKSNLEKGGGASLTGLADESFNFLEWIALGRLGDVFLRGFLSEFSRERLLSALSLVSKKVGELNVSKKGEGKVLERSGWRDYGPVVEVGQLGLWKDFFEKGVGSTEKVSNMDNERVVVEKIAGVIMGEISPLIMVGEKDKCFEIINTLRKFCTGHVDSELFVTLLLLKKEEAVVGAIDSSDVDPAVDKKWAVAVGVGRGKVVKASVREMLFRYLESHPEEALWLANEMRPELYDEERCRVGVEIIANKAYEKLKKKHKNSLKKFLLEFCIWRDHRRGKERVFVCKRYANSDVLDYVIKMFKRQ